MAVSQAEPLRIVEKRHGFHHRFVVVERLAHPHEDDVGDAFAARRQLAHIVRAPQMCSRKLCRRTRACCGEPKQCLAIYLPLLPPAKVAELSLDGRKSRRGRARKAG